MLVVGKAPDLEVRIMNAYPAISFAVRNKTLLRLSITVISFFAVTYLAFRVSSVEVGVFAIVGWLALYFILALAFEILQLIYETLVPQL
jgi:hypothetical protein